jgi:hypothetical protein
MFKWLFGDLSKKEVQDDVVRQVGLDPDSYINMEADPPCNDDERIVYEVKNEAGEIVKEVSVPTVSQELRKTQAELRGRNSRSPVAQGFTTRPDFLPEYYTEVQRIIDIKRLGLHVNEYSKLTKDEKDTIHHGFKLLVECGAMEVLDNVRQSREENEPRKVIEWEHEPSASPAECVCPPHGDNNGQGCCKQTDAGRDVAPDSDTQ